MRSKLGFKVPTNSESAISVPISVIVRPFLFHFEQVWNYAVNISFMLLHKMIGIYWLYIENVFKLFKFYGRTKINYACMFESLLFTHFYPMCNLIKISVSQEKNSAIPKFYLKKKKKIDIAYRQLIFPINQMYFYPQQIGFNHPHLFLFCTHM